MRSLLKLATCWLVRHEITERHGGQEANFLRRKQQSPNQLPDRDAPVKAG